MALTNTQLYTLRNQINADPALSSQPMNDDGHMEIAKLLRVTSTVDVWHTATPVQNIINAVDWSKYTPVDSVADSAIPDSLTADRRQAQLLAIQTKQMNLQLMLQGRDYIDASKSVIRSGLRDCTIAVPAGAAGASVNPGGPNGSTVLAACMRKANKGESFYVTEQATTGSGTTNLSTAWLLVFEGEISAQDVSNARNLP